MGYVEDIFGRRYRVPRELSYKAINAKIQGTAAGVMKRAMIRVDLELRRRRTRARMLIQVHDELVIEAPTSGWRQVARIARLAMEDRQTFAVLLPVDLKIGRPSWGDTEAVSA